MYTLIGGTRSRAFRVRWLLEELDLPYDHHATGPQSDEVKAHYPAGKIPVLLDGSTALTDSTAILTYLSDKHAALTHSAGSIERALQDGHTQFVLDEMDSLLWTAARHGFVLPEDKRVPAVKESLKWEYETSLKRLETRLGDGPFLMGDTMTIADIIAVHCLGWAIVAKFPQPEGPVSDYFNCSRKRPAYTLARSD